MPIPIKGQSKEDFFKICIPEIKGEGKTDDQAIGQCNGIWEQHLKEAKHSHDKCMECSQPPRYEVVWAEGMGHAWFCEKHLRDWATNGDGQGDIDYCKEVKEGQASKKFAENKNPNIWDDLKKKWNLRESTPLEQLKDWTAYNPFNYTDSEILSENFRFLSACYVKQKAGEDTIFKNTDNILQTSAKTIKRILDLDDVTFHSDQMKAESIELLRESLGQIIKAGPYLAPPHGELVWKDKQKSIVRVTENKKLENMGMLSSGQLVYGFIRFYPPDDIDLNEFKECDNDHRMTEAELGEKPARFLYYRVREFIPFEIPKQADIPDPFLRDDERFFESTSMPKDWDLGSLTMDELLKIHSMVHDEATQFSLTTSNPPDEGLIGRHKLITSEFKKHGMGHLILSELDKLSENINMDGAIQLKQLSNALKEGVSIRRPLLSFIGESCSSGWGKKVDIHIDWPVHDTKFIDMIKFNLQALLPPKLKESFNLVSDYKGPDVDFIPFAEMVLKVIPTESRVIMKMAESDISAGTLREARINDVKMKRQAEQSRKEDKVELFRFFMQISDVPGVSPPVANTIDEMIKAVNERWVKGNKFPQIQVLQKFGGTRAQIHTAGSKVLILDENGKDVTDSFPLIVEEAAKQGSDFIVDVNITNDPKAGIHIANVFDAVLILEDIHNKPLSERRSLLENLKSGKYFDIANRELVKSEGALKIALKNASNLPGSQGAVIKLWDGKYPLEGSSSKWMRLKK